MSSLAALLAPLVLSLLAPATAFAAPPAPAPPPPPAPPAPTNPAQRFEAGKPKKSKDDCRDSAVADPVLEAALRALSFEGAGEAGRRPLHDVQLAGLKTLNEQAVWDAIGGKPPAIDSAYAALAMRRLAALGVFASLTPVIDTRAAGGPLLTLHVVEHATVRKVVFEGLGELKPEGMLDALLDVPSQKQTRARLPKKLTQWLEDLDPDNKDKRGEDKARDRDRDDDDDDDDEHDGDDRRKKDKHGICADPLPPREWLARAEDETVFPGIAWKGLLAGLERVAARVFDKGYQLSRITAALSPDGTLAVRVEEGRVGSVAVAGVAPRLEGRVRELVGIQPGQPFVRSDLDDAIKRIQKAYPFLRADKRERNELRPPRVVERADGQGNVAFISEPRPITTGGTFFTVDVNDGRVTLYFKSKTFEQAVEAEELIRHTPVTNFAPGLEGRLRVWDAADRAHLRVRAAGNVNTTAATRLVEVPSPALGGAPVGTPDPSQRWRFDWTAEVSFLVPTLRLAELGIQGYSRNDTFDRWRIDRVDSYLYSMIFNRADSDYFRRNGLTAFATFHLFDQLTAGLEYRNDRYRSLSSAIERRTLFNRDELEPFNPLIDDGKLGSLLFRLEYSSVSAPAHAVGKLFRDAERTIVDRPADKYAWAELRTLHTLEVASTGLGSDRASFVRLVSDSAVFVRTGSEQGLKLRFRAAGALDGDLPRQKQEALGGFTALRGYGFKDQRGGDFSLLGTAEYRLDVLSLFVDVGSLRRNGDFGAAKAGIGGSFNFSDTVHFDLAWRADDQARLRPEIRLLFHRTY